MGNGSSPQEFPRAGTRLSSGSKVWTISQAIIGPLVVAGVIWLVSDRNRAWDTLESVKDQLKINEIENERLHDIINRRLSQKRKELDELSDAVRQSELQVQRLWVEFAKLPPNQWQERILRNERDITVLKSKEE